MSALLPLDGLLDALRAESDALDLFAARADAQLAALGQPGAEHLTAAAASTAEAVIAMDAARQIRERAAVKAARAAGLAEDAPLKALADSLPPADAARVLSAREHTRSRARHAEARCDALGFAMSYAASLGRELLDAWQHLDVPRPTRVYTAAGATTPTAAPLARLDQVG